MIKFLKDKTPLIFFTLFILSVIPFCGRLLHKQTHPQATYELFQPELERLDSPEKLLLYADSVYYAQHTGSFDTGAYAATLSLLTKQRFYHGSLDYSISDNWIAYLAGKLLWSHLSSIVIPEDILQHSRGLCSQQTIVFMKLLRMKNISVRSVGLGYKEGPGHFLCEIRYQGDWHIHDVSIEPVWSRIQNDHLSMNHYLSKKDSLFLVYESKLPKATFYKLLEKVEYGEVNKMPAGNMSAFHRGTLFLTYALPLIFVVLSVAGIIRKRKAAEVYSMKRVNQPDIEPATDLYVEKVVG